MIVRCVMRVFAVLGNGRLVVWSVKDGNRIEDISLLDMVEDGTRLKKDAVDEDGDAPSSDVSEITLRN